MVTTSNALTLAEVGDGFTAVGNAIADAAIASGKWIGRNWTTYVVPALACSVAIINTGFGFGTIAIIIGICALATSNTKKFQATVGATAVDSKDDYKWIRLSLQLVAAISFLAAGGLVFKIGAAPLI